MLAVFPTENNHNKCFEINKFWNCIELRPSPLPELKAAGREERVVARRKQVSRYHYKLIDSSDPCSREGEFTSPLPNKRNRLLKTGNNERVMKSKVELIFYRKLLN